MILAILLAQHVGYFIWILFVYARVEIASGKKKKVQRARKQKTKYQATKFLWRTEYFGEFAVRTSKLSDPHTHMLLRTQWLETKSRREGRGAGVNEEGCLQYISLELPFDEFFLE